MKENPAKIPSDNIREALVIIQFTTRYNIEHLTKHLHERFKEEFKLLPSENEPVFNFFIKENSKFDVKLLVDNRKEIKIALLPGLIVFNIYKQYIGWKKYKERIQKIIDFLLSEIEKIDNVTLRYISEYKNRSLYDIINLKLELPAFNDNKDTTIIQKIGTLEDKNYVIILTDSLAKEKEYYSYIDIALSYNFSNDNPKDLMSVLEELHTKEKELYLALLKT